MLGRLRGHNISLTAQLDPPAAGVVVRFTVTGVDGTRRSELAISDSQGKAVIDFPATRHRQLYQCQMEAMYEGIVIRDSTSLEC